MSGTKPDNPFTRDKFDAVLFDLDGVLTDRQSSFTCQGATADGTGELSGEWS